MNEKRVVNFDSSQKNTQDNKKSIKYKNKKSNKTPKNEQSNDLLNIFSKGWNAIRFIFFLAVIIFIFSVLLSTFSVIPDGESFSWSIFFAQLHESLGVIGCSSPIIGPIFEKIVHFLTEGNFKFIFFLSSLFLTISLLVCFCP